MGNPARRGVCPDCGRLIATRDAAVGPFTVPRLVKHNLAPHVVCRGTDRIPRNGATEPVPTEGAPA